MAVPRAASGLPMPPVTDAGRDPAEIESSLRSAVARDELRLVFQPEFDLRSGAVTAIEALVRWLHPSLGELEPDSFISLAERSGLIREVGAWVIDNALEAFASWSANGLSGGIVLRINVSPVQLADTAFADQLAAALTEHGVAGESVCVELTEHEPLRDPEAVAESLRRLKALGVISAIDDLATGYSTLSNLRLLPFDVIKIDRTLVSGIDHDVRAQLIVSAIIGLAGSFEVGVVAEGVENDAELAMLLRLGCDRAQGHHLGKPMAAEAIRQLLSDAYHSTERAHHAN
jgi:EAL domain-containing protein (putative c-di-GMP-specific phosphodiesterase class I)